MEDKNASNITYFLMMIAVFIFCIIIIVLSNGYALPGVILVIYLLLRNDNKKGDI